MEASTSVTFLDNLPAEPRQEIIREIMERLDHSRTGNGVVNTYNTIHAVAKK
jgi:hypothetical protein